MPSSSLWSRTHCRPARTSDVFPLPASSRTRTETRFAAGAMPARRPPAEWLPLPTRMPATCVPWPFGSMLLDSARVVSSGRSRTAVALGSRRSRRTPRGSGCRRAAPRPSPAWRSSLRRPSAGSRALAAAARSRPDAPRPGPPTRARRSPRTRRRGSRPASPRLRRGAGRPSSERSRELAAQPAAERLQERPLARARRLAKAHEHVDVGPVCRVVASFSRTFALTFPAGVLRPAGAAARDAADARASTRPATPAASRLERRQ